ncbi:MAG: DUF3097 family protein [Ilumatobacteraceae bacterium]
MTRDILDEFDAARRDRGRPAPSVPATVGLVVEHRASGFVGDVVAVDLRSVTLRDRHGRQRLFALDPSAYVVDGRPATLVRPSAQPSAPVARVTNSGSVAGGPAVARVAAASRIWVEGRHDAELVEHVWGDDLRELGIVVEPMHGIDDLAAAIAAFGPSPGRRLGVLVDHLVPGSKEQRLVDALPPSPHVLVVGHPFVDVWAAVRPHLLGIDEWPSVPRGTPWKEGVCTALGVDPTTFWPRLRNLVTTYADLRPEMVGSMERLLDFVAPVA